MLQVQCITEPCCPQWTCDDTRQVDMVPETRQEDQCPDTKPDNGSPCWPDGLVCDYDEQHCCGETFPLLESVCIDGEWWGHYVNTLCSIGTNESFYVISSYAFFSQ